MTPARGEECARLRDETAREKAAAKVKSRRLANAREAADRRETERIRMLQVTLKAQAAERRAAREVRA